MLLGELILEFSSQERFLFFTFSFLFYKKNYFYFWQLPKAVAIICRKYIYVPGKSKIMNRQIEILN